MAEKIYRQSRFGNVIFSVDEQTSHTYIRQLNPQSPFAQSTEQTRFYYPHQPTNKNRSITNPSTRIPLHKRTYTRVSFGLPLDYPPKCPLFSSIKAFSAGCRPSAEEPFLFLPEKRARLELSRAVHIARDNTKCHLSVVAFALQNAHVIKYRASIRIGREPQLKGAKSRRLYVEWRNQLIADGFW